MNPSPRQPWIDWLRFGAIAAVVLYHAAMPFGQNKWLIQNAQKSPALEELIHWLHRFRMPLLFFVSGTVSWYMLQRKSAGSFIQLRLRRLLIPLIFGMLIIVPPQIYLQRVNEGYAGNFFSFYPASFTRGTYPRGDFGWHHLWFIAYLLVYDIAFAPLFKWLISPKGKLFLEKTDGLARGLRIYWLALPSVLLYASLSERFPETNNLFKDYFYFFYWLLFLLAGFYCGAQPLFLQSVQRNRQSSLGIAAVSTLTLHGLTWSSWVPDTTATAFFVRALSALCAWSSVFALIGYGRKYLTGRTPFLDYINNALYPFFILHQAVLVWLAFYVVRLPYPVGVKYISLLILTVLISMSFYHFIIRRVSVLRGLFGMPVATTAPKPVSTGNPAVSAPTALPGETFQAH